MTDQPRRLARQPYRSHTCGQLRASDAGPTARLSGWVHRRRDHGQLIFLDLRDRHGITQVVVDATDAPARPCGWPAGVRSEFVITVDGHGRRAPGRHGEPRAGDRRDRAARRPRSRSCPRRRRRRSTSTSPTPRSTRRSGCATATSTSGASRCSSGCSSARGWSRRSAAVHHAQRLRRDRDARPDQVDARGRPRLHRPVAAPAGDGLRPAAEPAAAQAAADGRRASIATSRSPAASATRTCAATASPSSPSSTSR